MIISQNFEVLLQYMIQLYEIGKNIIVNEMYCNKYLYFENVLYKILLFFKYIHKHEKTNKTGSTEKGKTGESYARISG